MVRSIASTTIAAAAERGGAADCAVARTPASGSETNMKAKT